ncbi:hypothetical protein GLOTRDRAFT_140421 [Gloeophyllum trabeum ATCC 11539]|uniref:Methyltransferase domain-containing protein n=1 Tax=Gloeophyllum trabeum (strain ATCC 11539 / FP-39264 / Madison 617) TaxID=670483 RepID=S7REX5_GLOTA|nr:uncharacterized protein GLOTRDRAFT_140421 [Gloeophyllum trabeum ATCC 11539]EPQ52800.1 hypothetical protein GLOTRDRAFT_140421 [Gloeophyllum trabeum ATCC 11539]
MTASVGKDVQAELLRGRRHKRRAGEVPYPLVYTSDLMDFDNWNHMYMQSIFKSLTVHHIEQPPRRVLDLGCGGGFWVINAAQQWEESTFVGFDIQEVQPNLERLPEYEDICRRVEWVHGNFLERLPFPSAHFDFVRMASIGLGVPEDEWQDLLEEIYRILKPGAYLEVVEDDLIFPCGPLPTSATPSPALSSVILPTTYGISSRSFSTARSSTLYDSDTPTSDQAPSLPKTFQSDSQNSLVIPGRTSKPRDQPYVNDNRDHSKLKAAWDAMLHTRFLAPRLLSVLPFYLSSLDFVDLQTHAALNIPLPPNSMLVDGGRRAVPAPDTRIDLGDILELKARLKRPSGEAGAKLKESPNHRSLLVQSCAPIHLMRTIRLISACKEAIWDEFQRLYGDDPKVHPLKERPSQNTCRDEFEVAWYNWYNDMMDRASMRDHVQSSLMWQEPLQDFERPEWKVWRQGVGPIDDLEEPSSPGSEQSTCRIIRAFVARKPAAKGKNGKDDKG